MTKPVLLSARNAHFDYHQRCELLKEKEEKERKELIQRREADEMRQKEREQLIEQNALLTEKDKSLDNKEKNVKNSLTAVLDLLMKGNEKLKSAVEKGVLYFSITSCLHKKT